MDRESGIRVQLTISNSPCVPVIHPKFFSVATIYQLANYIYRCYFPEENVAYE
jgi:hypothetical protein